MGYPERLRAYEICRLVTARPEAKPSIWSCHVRLLRMDVRLLFRSVFSVLWPLSRAAAFRHATFFRFGSSTADLTTHQSIVRLSISPPSPHSLPPFLPSSLAQPACSKQSPVDQGDGERRRRRRTKINHDHDDAGRRRKEHPQMILLLL